mmetsp:Transcript_3854/g.5729  ORF Transcript_3854/g.5729 Transcript_3854/m.5729 type:complete len:202 (+) Transcript_3854:87-692(+)
MDSNLHHRLPIILLFVLSLLQNHVSLAFVHQPNSFLQRKTSPFSTVSSSPSALQMCICINCKYVTDCAAYHFVETKHEQPHMTNKPTFEPRDGSPTIHVNVRTIRTREDREKEIERMWREHEEQTKLAMEKKKEGKESGEADVDDDDDDERLVGENKYDLTPVTTYEYDVVKCEDFVLEQDCWIKNMPEEIKKANPNFVPS